VALLLVRPGGPAATGAAHQAAESAIPAPAPPPERVDAVPAPQEPAQLEVVISAPPPPAAPDPQAVEAKHASQQALEKGRTAQAIEAGERSVELDPGDAEAWLILGAAYDQRGAYAKARACFQKCVDQASHGPKGECAALLR
jgi:tetratricopeptide (TPR) repeat protein